MKKFITVVFAAMISAPLCAEDNTAPARKDAKKPKAEVELQAEEIPLKTRLHNALEQMVTVQEQLTENLESAKKLGPKTTTVRLAAYMESLQLINEDTAKIKKELMSGFMQKDTPEDNEARKLARAVTAYSENMSKTAEDIHAAVGAYAASIKPSSKKGGKAILADEKAETAAKAEKASAKLEKTCKQLRGVGKWFEAALK